MTNEVNANIGIHINTKDSIVQLQALQNEVNQLQRSLASMGTRQAQQSARYGTALMEAANAGKNFRASLVPVSSSVDDFTKKLEKNKFSLGEYTKYAASQMPGMRRMFVKEFDTIQRVAESRVRKIATQYVALGDAVGKTQKAIALTPTGGLDLKSHATQAALAAQRQQIFNKILADGSTKMLNWGKNTQWAGRQLMVGFTIPLTMLGVAAAKTFKEIDKASIAFKRVYGDLNTTTNEMEKNLDAVKRLGMEYTKYGVAVSQTIDLASRVAATGATNEKLMAATEQTLRLATLGQMDYNEALDATISLQTAFRVSNKQLAEDVDYLNAVENQTVLTIQDMAAAIPRVAPVIKGLGGDVKDLAVFMTAMKEGGVSAENGANALKSGLASLINPTKRAQETLNRFGIDLKGIIKANAGDLMGTVKSFAAALSKLDEFSQQQSLEQIFGKYQYARIGALFKNIANDSGQAARAMELAGKSTSELGMLANKELSALSNATSTKFQATVEKLKFSLAPLGEQFMKIANAVLPFITKLADGFNNLPDVIKNGMLVATTAIAGIGPVILMTVGLMANGFANIAKFVNFLRESIGKMKNVHMPFQYIADAELEASTATAQLEGRMSSLTNSMVLQQGAIRELITLYGTLAGASRAAATGMPSMTRAGKTAMPAPKEYNSGVTRVPGTGNRDTIPALLTPGESVITKEATRKYAPIISAMNNGNLPGFNSGVEMLAARAYGRSAPQTFKNTIRMRDAAMVEAIQSPAYKESIMTKEIRDALKERGVSNSHIRKIDYLFSEVDIAHRQKMVSGGEKFFTGKTSFVASALENRGLNNIFSSNSWDAIAPQLTKNQQKLLNKLRNGFHPTSVKDIRATQALLKKGVKIEKEIGTKAKWFENGWDIIVSQALSQRLSGGHLRAAARAQASSSFLNQRAIDKEYNKAFGVRKLAGGVVGINVMEKLFAGRRAAGMMGSQSSAVNANQMAHLNDDIVRWLGGRMERVNFREMAKTGVARALGEKSIYRGITMKSSSNGYVGFAPEVQDALYKYSISRNPNDLAPFLGKPIAIEPRSFSTSRRIAKGFTHEATDTTAPLVIELKNDKGIFGIDPYKKFGQQSKDVTKEKRDWKNEKEIIPVGDPTRGTPNAIVGNLTLDRNGNIVIDAGASVSKRQVSSAAQRLFEGKNSQKTSKQIIQSEIAEVQRLENQVTNLYKQPMKYWNVAEIEDLAARLVKTINTRPPATTLVDQKAYNRLTQRKSVLSKELQKILMKVGGNIPDGLNMNVRPNRKSIPQPQQFAKGGVVPGRGNKDTIPALLTPGESVITKEATRKYAPILHQMNKGTLPGFQGGFIPDAARGELGHGSPYVTYNQDSPQFKAVMETTKNQGLIGASSLRGYTNWVWDVPNLQNNQRSMTGSEMAKMFNSRKARNKMMRPIIKAIAEQMQMKPKELLRSPEARLLIKTLGDNMGKELGALGDRMVHDKNFYAANEKAVRNSLAAVASNNPELAKAVERARTQITTVSAKKGSSVTRVGISKFLQESSAFGYKNGMTSYKANSAYTPRTSWESHLSKYLTPEGDALRAANSQSMRNQYSSKPATAIPAASSAAAEKIAAFRGSAAPNSIEQRMKGIQEKRQAQSMKVLDKEFAARNRWAEKRAMEYIKKGISPQSAMQMALSDHDNGKKPMERVKVPQTAQIVEEEAATVSKRTGMMGKMGGALARGAMPLSMALGMGSMIPMMAQNKEGKFMGMDANAAMIGMMGGSAALGLLPMLPAAVAGPVAAVTAAAALLVAGMVAWRKSVDGNAKKSAELGAAMGGTANTLNTMAAVMGTMTPAQRQTKLALNISARDEQKFGEMAAQLQTEAGQKMLSDLKTKTTSQRVQAVSDYIVDAIAAGIMDNKTGQIFAKAVGAALNDVVLGTAASSAIRDAKSDPRALLERANQRLSVFSKSANVTAVRESQGARSVATDTASFAIGGAIQIVQQYSNVIAKAREDYLAGTLAYNEYINILKDASKVQAEYTQIVAKSVSNAVDMQGARQALDTQLVAGGLTQDQVDALTHATDIGIANGFAGTGLNFFGSGLSAYRQDYVDAQLRSRNTSKGQISKEDYQKLLDESANAQKAAKALFDSGLNENLKMMVVAGKMQADQAVAFGQELMNNPNSAAAKQYAKKAKEGNAILGLEQGVFMSNVNAGAIPDLNVAQQNKVIEIGIKYSEMGGNLEEFQAFLNNAPKEKRVDFITSVSGDITARTLDALLGMTASGTESGQTLATSKIVLNLARESKPNRVASDQKDLPRGMQISDISAEKVQQLEAMRKQLVDAVGDEAAASLVVELDTKYNGKTTDVSKMAMEGKLLAITARDIKGEMTQEHQIMFGIDFKVSRSFKEFSEEDARVLELLGNMIDGLPQEYKQLGIDLALNENGDPKDVKTWLADTRQGISLLNKLKSGKESVKKEAILEIYTLLNNGKKADPAQADAALQALIKRWGKKKIMKLPPFVLQQAWMLQIDAQDIKDKAAALRSAGGGFGGAAGAAQLDALASAAEGRADTAISFDTPFGGNNTGGGGGNKEKPWWKQLLDDSVANTKMFPKELNKLKKKFNMPQQILDMIGVGEEGMKRLKQLTGLSIQKIKEIINKFNKSVVALGIRSLDFTIGEQTIQNDAKKTLLGMGFSEEDAKQIASNSEYAFMIQAASADKSGKSLKVLGDRLKEIIRLTEEAKSPVERMQDAWNNYANAVDAAFEVEKTRVENSFAAKKYNTILGQLNVEQIQNEIDKNQTLIQGYQDRIDIKQEEINDYQHENDVINQRIDALSREDELRNRISDAISHDLEIMSKQEDSIRNAYQKRIDALEKVISINDHLINQQKQQLGLADALSRGDISAAAAAAQEMQAAEAQYATEQIRSGLEQGMQNQIDSLRTSEGLTRAEAEKKISDIKEQSYQTTLKIRQEEDLIYYNNSRITTLTNEIYKINEDLIEPLTNQNNAYQRILETHQKDLDYAINHLTAAGLTSAQWKAAKDEQAALVASISSSIDKVNQYREAWDKAAASARAAFSYTGTNVPTNSGLTAKESVDPATGIKITKYEGGADRSYINPFTGEKEYYNVGGMIKKYASGSLVAGSGSRDSVPAMLTPGEFVVRKAMVQKYGLPMLQSMNLGSFDLPKYNVAKPSYPTNVSKTQANISAPVYNTYSISVPVTQPNASADEIANRVIMKIRNIENSSIRGINGY